MRAAGHALAPRAALPGQRGFACRAWELDCGFGVFPGDARVKPRMSRKVRGASGPLTYPVPTFATSAFMLKRYQLGGARSTASRGLHQVR